MDILKRIRKRLILVNLVVAATTVFGILAVIEATKGVYFQNLNIAHLLKTTELEEQLSVTDFRLQEQVRQLRDSLVPVAEQSEACLEAKTWAWATWIRLMGTDRAFELCRQDNQLVSDAIAGLDAYLNGSATPQQARQAMEDLQANVKNNGTEFSTLMGATFETVLFRLLTVIAIIGCLSIYVLITTSRMVMRLLQETCDKQKKLQKRNVELTSSLATLRKQKAEIYEAHQKAEHNALHDPLTNLPNRRYLNHKIEAWDHQDQRLALLHIDVDHFKQINDSKGHAAGDFVLVHVAKTLSGLLRNDDFVARVGGDEFVVIAAVKTRDQNKQKHLRALAERIIKTLNAPVEYKTDTIDLSVSVGIALQTKDEFDPQTLLNNADIALYRSKSEGRNRFGFFDTYIERDIVERPSMKTEIAEAIEKQEFVVQYQPVFDTATDQVGGMEALIRWQHPEKGLMLPATFLPIAEEAGLLHKLDQFVLRTAWNELKRYDAVGLSVPRLSVNISSSSLTSPGFLTHLKDLTVEPRRLSLEVPEADLPDYTSDEMHFVLDSIREMGIDLDVDGFGRGQTSLLTLLRLRPKRVKIDRHLVRLMDGSQPQSFRIHSLFEIAETLNIEVVAYGVETQSQIETVKELSCQSIQGFACALPMRSQELERFLREKQSVNGQDVA